MLKVHVSQNTTSSQIKKRKTIYFYKAAGGNSASGILATTEILEPGLEV
jgi:hypothetical protein